VGADHTALFQLLWSREDGTVADVEEACMSALQHGLEFQHQIKHAEIDLRGKMERRHSKREMSGACVVS